MAFSITDLSLAFDGRSILDNISITAHPGDIVCLLGPSGCGKTTTLRVLAGLERPQSGRVEINGEVVCDDHLQVAPEKRDVGYLFQDYALFPHLSVGDNVGFGIQKHPERLQIIKDQLKRVNLDGFADAMPHTLSGGQQQRVALARALARNPKIMLLDEPFSGLDTTLKLQLRESTHRLLKANKATAVIVTHDPVEAMYMADQIVLMDSGRVIQSGRPDTLYFKPVNAFAAEFFGAVLKFSGVVLNGQVQTAVGTFDITDHPEGSLVTLYVRPESLSLNNPDYSPAKLTVVHSHFVGSHYLVDLTDPAGTNPDFQISVPAQSIKDFASGQEVSVTAHKEDILLVLNRAGNL